MFIVVNPTKNVEYNWIVVSSWKEWIKSMFDRQKLKKKKKSYLTPLVFRLGQRKINQINQIERTGQFDIGN